MAYTCPGCGATDEEKKDCCGGSSEAGELAEEVSGKENEESGIEEELEKE